jgi:hypothetical protein
MTNCYPKTGYTIHAIIYCEAEYPASWGEPGRKASMGYIVFGRRTRRAKSRNAPSACGGDRDFEPAEFTLLEQVWMIGF